MSPSAGEFNSQHSSSDCNNVRKGTSIECCQTAILRLRHIWVGGVLVVRVVFHLDLIFSLFSSLFCTLKKNKTSQRPLQA